MVYGFLCDMPHPKMIQTTLNIVHLHSVESINQFNKKKKKKVSKNLENAFKEHDSWTVVHLPVSQITVASGMFDGCCIFIAFSSFL